MIPLTVAQIADVVGGRVDGDADTGRDVTVTAPATLDSRSVEAGGLFVALAGAQVDGHDFASAAFDSGAAAVLASRPVGGPAVIVDDVTRALGLLGRHVADHLDAQVVALTGSHGKTSVKDLLGHLLSAHGETVATAGNFNNELGVPLTVLRATPSTRWLVVEMGARGIGHIRELCEIAPPDIAMVLNVGSAHVGEFGSIENIAVAKGEIVESLRPGGRAVLNADDPRVAVMASRVPIEARTVRFGRSATGDEAVHVVDVSVDASGEPDVTLEHAGRTWTSHVPLPGDYQAMNLAAAHAALVGLGLTGEGARLDDFSPASPHRMQRSVRADGVVVIDDAYNANPDSVAASLRTLAAIDAPRRVAVLGEMLELGPDAVDQHLRIGRLAAELGITRLVAVGDGARPIANGFGPQAEAVPDVDEAVELLSAWLTDGDVVLVKASRGARLERVADALRGA